MPVDTMTHYLRSGHLVSVLSGYAAESVPVSVIYPKNRHLSSSVRAFVDWISERLSAAARV